MGLRILPVNFFDEAVVTVSSAKANFPVSNLQIPGRGDTWRSANLDVTTIHVHWNGNARPISAFGVAPGNLIGSEQQLYLYRNADETSVLYSNAWEFFPYSGAGWGDNPGDPWGGNPWGISIDDRSFARAMLTKYFTQQTASSAKIVMVNKGGMDASTFESSRIWLASSVDAPYKPRYGAEPAWVSSSDLHRDTPGGTLRRLAGETWKELRFETLLRTETDRARWLDLQYLCDPSREILVSFFPGEDSRRERDFTVMGSLKSLSAMPWTNHELHTLPMAITES